MFHARSGARCRGPALATPQFRWSCSRRRRRTEPPGQPAQSAAPQDDEAWRAKLSHELAAKATARAQSSSSAARQTPRSRRVSRSRSKGTEVDSTETSARGVEVLVIGKMGWKAPPVRWGEQEDQPCQGEVWTQAQDAAMDLQQENSEMDNSLGTRDQSTRPHGIIQLPLGHSCLLRVCTGLAPIIDHSRSTYLSALRAPSGLPKLVCSYSPPFYNLTRAWCTMPSAWNPNGNLAQV